MQHLTSAYLLFANLQLPKWLTLVMEFDLEAINLFLAKPVLMSPRFRRDHCTVNHSKLINLLLNQIHLLEFLKQNRFFSHHKETNQPWIFCNLNTAQFKVKLLIEMLLRVKALTFYAHKTVCFIFKDSYLFVADKYVWTIGQSFRLLNQSCWIWRGCLLIHVAGYDSSPDFLFKAEPCTV